MQGMTDAHLVIIEVAGCPATFATESEKLWKHADRAAVAASGVQPRAEPDLVAGE
jgi:hypothetical protein